MFEKDIKKCYDYTVIVFWDFLNILKFSVPDPFMAVVTTGLIMHKSPIVFRTCKRVLENTKQFDKAIELYSSRLLTIDVGANLMENLMFNLGDVLFNMVEAREHLKNLEFKEFGENAGRIVIDLLYVNPHDGRYIWNEEKSAIIIADGTQKGSYKVPSSYFSSNLQVGASALGSMLFEQGKKDVREAENSVHEGADALEAEIMNRNLMFDEAAVDLPFEERFLRLRDDLGKSSCIVEAE